MQKQERTERRVMGPMGDPVTLETLEAWGRVPRGQLRWVARRKAELVAAVRGELISLTDACNRFDLTEDEFLSWERDLKRHGVPGLRTTRIIHYKNTKQRAGHDFDLDRPMSEDAARLRSPSAEPAVRTTAPRLVPEGARGLQQRVNAQYPGSGDDDA
jgi:hypothetical protein